MRNNQYCIILAGGIGTRLWPASRQQMPKQFLDILGTGETLLQATYKRYAKFIDKENIIVMSNELYKDLTLQQLPELPTSNLLLEPMRRNTVPSVVWAAIHLTRVNPNAVMLVTPADQLITDESTFEHDMRYGFDYNDLAQVSGIQNPDRIFAGNIIHFPKSGPTMTPVTQGNIYTQAPGRG